MSKFPSSSRAYLIPYMHQYENGCRLKTKECVKLRKIAYIPEKSHFRLILSYFSKCYYCIMRIFKFLIVGAIGLSVNLGIFHTLYVLGVQYLIGSISALLIAMVVGFVLQKYWTFEERSHERTRIQFMFYVALSLCNLGVN